MNEIKLGMAHASATASLPGVLEPRIVPISPFKLASNLAASAGFAADAAGMSCFGGCKLVCTMMPQKSFGKTQSSKVYIYKSLQDHIRVHCNLSTICMYNRDTKSSLTYVASIMHNSKHYSNEIVVV